MTKPEEMTYQRFCKIHGLTDDTDVFMHINASMRTQPTTKTFHRWNDSQLSLLQGERDESKRLYREALERGDICEPKEPGLDQKCEGMPDLSCTQAAIRVREILKADGKYREGM